jgi:hypothetical protein
MQSFQVNPVSPCEFTRFFSVAFVFEDATVFFDYLCRGDIVIIAGNKSSFQAEKSRFGDSQFQYRSSITFAPLAGPDSISDVPAKFSQIVIQPVPQVARSENYVIITNQPECRLRNPAIGQSFAFFPAVTIIDIFSDVFEGMPALKLFFAFACGDKVMHHIHKLGLEF